MQQHWLLSLLICYLWIIPFTYELECTVNDEINDPLAHLFPEVRTSRIKRRSANVKACYLAIETDFVTNKTSVNLTELDKNPYEDAENGFFRTTTLLTVDVDPAINDSLQTLFELTCTFTSFCNGAAEKMLGAYVNMIPRLEFNSSSLINTLRQILVKNKNTTISSEFLYCFVDNSQKPIECKTRLCSVKLADPLEQSCGSGKEIMDGKVQVKIVAYAPMKASIGSIKYDVYVTCNFNQCNGQETANQVKEIIGMNSLNIRDTITNIGWPDDIESPNEIDLSSLLDNASSNNRSLDNTQSLTGNMSEEQRYKEKESGSDSNSNVMSITSTLKSSAYAGAVYVNSYSIFILHFIGLVISLGF